MREHLLNMARQAFTKAKPCVADRRAVHAWTTPNHDSAREANGEVATGPYRSTPLLWTREHIVEAIGDLALSSGLEICGV